MLADSFVNINVYVVVLFFRKVIQMELSRGRASVLHNDLRIAFLSGSSGGTDMAGTDEADEDR